MVAGIPQLIEEAVLEVEDFPFELQPLLAIADLSSLGHLTDTDRRAITSVNDRDLTLGVFQISFLRRVPFSDVKVLHI